jgi:hypothetical protein
VLGGGVMVVFFFFFFSPFLFWSDANVDVVEECADDEPLLCDIGGGT